MFCLLILYIFIHFRVMYVVTITGSQHQKQRLCWWKLRHCVIQGSCGQASAERLVFLVYSGYYNHVIHSVCLYNRLQYAITLYMLFRLLMKRSSISLETTYKNVWTRWLLKWMALSVTVIPMTMKLHLFWTHLKFTR